VCVCVCVCIQLTLPLHVPLPQVHHPLQQVQVGHLVRRDSNVLQGARGVCVYIYIYVYVYIYLFSHYIYVYIYIYVCIYIVRRETGHTQQAHHNTRHDKNSTTNDYTKRGVNPRRETGHTHKHTTRTPQHTTDQNNTTNDHTKNHPPLHLTTITEVAPRRLFCVDRRAQIPERVFRLGRLGGSGSRAEPVTSPVRWRSQGAPTGN